MQLFIGLKAQEEREKMKSIFGLKAQRIIAWAESPGAWLQKKMRLKFDV